MDQPPVAPTTVRKATAPVAPTTVRKVTVNFAPETYETLSGIAKRRNVSMSEALRQAIGLMSFFIDTMKTDDTKKNDDPKIMIQRGKQLTELKLL